MYKSKLKDKSTMNRKKYKVYVTGNVRMSPITPLTHQKLSPLLNAKKFSKLEVLSSVQNPYM